jgi:hypothetical protein
MATIAEMKLKVNRGVEKMHEADQLLNAAGTRLEEAAQIWETVSDHMELRAAINVVRRAIENVEQTITLKSSAVVQAERYSAGL